MTVQELRYALEDFPERAEIQFRIGDQPLLVLELRGVLKIKFEGAPPESSVFVQLQQKAVK